jgi:hypothetical protein
MTPGDLPALLREAANAITGLDKTPHYLGLPGRLRTRADELDRAELADENRAAQVIAGVNFTSCAESLAMLSIRKAPPSPLPKTPGEAHV